MGDSEIGESVDDRVDDDAERRGDPTFAAAAEAQWMGSRWHLADRGREERQVGGTRHRVIRKRACDELAARGIVDSLLEQRLTGALRDPAMGLAVRDQWVDSAPDIIGGGVAGDLDDAGLGVDFDLADVKSVRERGDLAHHFSGAGKQTAQLLGEARIVARRRRNRKEVERAVGPGYSEAIASGNCWLTERGTRSRFSRRMSGG